MEFTVRIVIKEVGRYTTHYKDWYLAEEFKNLPKKYPAHFGLVADKAKACKFKSRNAAARAAIPRVGNDKFYIERITN